MIQLVFDVFILVCVLWLGRDELLALFRRKGVVLPGQDPLAAPEAPIDVKIARAVEVHEKKYHGR